MGKNGKSRIPRARISANERIEVLTAVFTKIQFLGYVVLYRQAKHFQFGVGGTFFRASWHWRSRHHNAGNCLPVHTAKHTRIFRSSLGEAERCNWVMTMLWLYHQLNIGSMPLYRTGRISKQVQTPRVQMSELYSIRGTNLIALNTTVEITRFLFFVTRNSLANVKGKGENFSRLSIFSYKGDMINVLPLPVGKPG